MNKRSKKLTDMKLFKAEKKHIADTKRPSTQFLLRLFGVTCWASLHFKTGGWFRLFGYGLTWKDETEGLMFSERMGYTKNWKLGRWIVKPCR